MKEVISLSLEKELISKLESYSKENAKSRSSVLEEILIKFLNGNKTAVILAGGDPDKIKIDGKFRCLYEIKGKTILEHIIEKIIIHGYRNILFIGSNEINTSVFKILGNGERLNANIKFIKEENIMKSANTLFLAKDFVNSSFLFLTPDHYFDFDIRKLEIMHNISKYTSTIAIYGGINYSSTKSAMVELDGLNITNYWDTPISSEKSSIYSTLIGIAEPRIFDFIKKEMDMHADVFPFLIKNMDLGGVILSGNFVNVHTKKDIETMQKIL